MVYQGLADLHSMRLIKTGRQVYYEFTGAECQKLLDAAAEAMANTYPKSGVGYSAALLTRKGSIYVGSSYVSDTDVLTMHGEAVALAHAAVHGEKDVVAMTGPGCHICKQLVYESGLQSGIDIVWIHEENGKIEQIRNSALMLYPWPSEKTHQVLDKVKMRKTSKTRY